MATHVSELSMHAVRDAILQTQKEMRAARRNATPSQRKQIDLKIRFLEKHRISLSRACRLGASAQKLDIV